MTIADTLYDAANDIRDYLKDDVEPYDKLTAEIMHVTMMMDALREKIDSLGVDRPICEREFRKSQAQEETMETTQLRPYAR
jgi:hypothetical protein